jgi:hypothetical protein
MSEEFLKVMQIFEARERIFRWPYSSLDNAQITQLQKACSYVMLTRSGTTGVEIFKRSLKLF